MTEREKITIYESATNYIEREAVGKSLDELLSLYRLQDNVLCVLADGDDGTAYERTRSIVSILKSMIVSKVMHEHGYYQTDATGFSRWEKEN